MQALSLLAVGLMMVACGGATDRKLAGAAAGGSSSVGGAGASGAGTASGGLGSGAGQSGALGGAGLAGTAGGGNEGGESPGCAGLSCLNGVEALYLPDRQWQRSSAAQSDELDEADYTPLVGEPIPLRFSPDALSLQMLVEPDLIIYGKRDSTSGERAHFALDGFAGGRFLVWEDGTELAAEYTVYGSGVPVGSSTRGTLELDP